MTDPTPEAAITMVGVSTFIGVTGGALLAGQTPVPALLLALLFASAAVIALTYLLVHTLDAW